MPTSIVPEVDPLVAVGEDEKKVPGGRFPRTVHDLGFFPSGAPVTLKITLAACPTV
ncbi:MAG: hypothetical protein SFV32_06500 [Opitutaceae bacterium]|nr:hypothetical protein [Opitutaceae bacterium]